MALDRDNVITTLRDDFESNYTAPPPVAWPNQTFDKTTQSTNDAYIAFDVFIGPTETREIGANAKVYVTGGLQIASGVKLGVLVETAYTPLDTIAALYPKGSSVAVTGGIVRFLDPQVSAPLEQDDWLYVLLTCPFFLYT